MMKKVFIHNAVFETADDWALSLATEKVAALCDDNLPDEKCWASVVDASTMEHEYFLFWDGSGLTTYDVKNKTAEQSIMFHL